LPIFYELCCHYLYSFPVEFGETFADIAVREPQPRASESLMRFSEYHRRMERQGLMLIEVIKPVSIKKAYIVILSIICNCGSDI